MWKVLKSPKLFGLLTGQTLEHSGESSWCTITQGRDTQCVLLWIWSRRCVFSTASWTSSAVTFLSNASAGDTCWYYPLLQGLFRFVKTLRPKCRCFFLASMGCTPKLEICCLTLRLWEFDGWEQEFRILEDTLGSLGQPLSQNSITIFHGWTMLNKLNFSRSYEENWRNVSWKGCHQCLWKERRLAMGAGDLGAKAVLDVMWDTGGHIRKE